MISIAIVDSGPLIAAANRADPAHEECLRLLRDPKLHPVIPTLCVAEVAYLIGRRQGPGVEARFVRGLEDFETLAPGPDDWPRIGDLIDRYADLSLGAVDASVIATAERLGTDVVITLDRRHFEVVRPRHAKRFRLLPRSGGLKPPARR